MRPVLLQAYGPGTHHRTRPAIMCIAPALLECPSHKAAAYPRAASRLLTHCMLLSIARACSPCSRLHVLQASTHARIPTCATAHASSPRCALPLCPAVQLGCPGDLSACLPPASMQSLPDDLLHKHAADCPLAQATLMRANSTSRSLAKRGRISTKARTRPSRCDPAFAKPLPPVGFACPLRALQRSAPRCDG